jgi:uncharacterized membrane protein YkoI
MSSNKKSIDKVTPKYNCMVSGQKRMQPCSGCTNTKSCMTTTMQYKENEEMDQKAVLKIDADGAVVSCAKGADPSECGYTGGKVCGKCGAAAIMIKGDDDTLTIDLKVKKPKPDPDMVDEEGMIDMEGGPTPDAASEDEMMDDEEDMAKRRMAARNRRLQSMGVKSADISKEGFLCAVERKMHPNGGQVCATCPGGCAPEMNLPTVLEVEGIAEEMFGGKVLDSGYGYNSDLFLVEMERKDGKVIEVIFDGSTSECMGWQMLNTSTTDGMSQKSVNINAKVVGLDEAAEIALKSINGNVMAVDADKFEGIDAWAVEIDALDGKSYDVYVALDGEVVGYDVYEADEAEDIEAEVAEIALKRAYSDAEREGMAEEGFAMSDGSYPIKDESDLRNAIQAYGRAKDKEAAKKHIMKRARDLGMEEMIPSAWAMGKKDGEEDDSFLASLIEFEVLATEAEIETDTL